MEVILTSRPLSWKSPISWVNAITRAKTASPFDHIAIFNDGVDIIFESVSGHGVRSINFEEWVKNRKGTYIFRYKIPYPFRENINWDFFWENEGKKYDYKANILFLFGAKKGLKKNHTKKLFCSELTSGMLGLDKPYSFTPEDIQEYCMKSKWSVKIEKI